MSDRFSDPAIALIEEPVLGHLATVDSAGRPHVTPMWIGHDGGELLVNTAAGRVKTRNMEHDPHVGHVDRRSR